MRNTDCIIYMITKRGSKQIYRKDNKGWAQTSSKGIVRRMTAEQLLSHLLPPLTAEYKPCLTVRVERINRRKKTPKKAKKIECPRRRNRHHGTSE